MKKITLILLSLLMAAGSYAQSVGINSTGAAPSNNAMLEVIQSGTSGTAYGLYGTATGAATTNYGGYFSATGASNNYGLVVPNGNVGIGTTTPLSLLQVGSAATSQIAPGLGTYGQVAIRASEQLLSFGLSNSDPWASWIQSSNPNTSGALPLALNPSGGNVGIGTTSPSYLLDVNGAINGSSVLVNGIPVASSNDTYWEPAGSGKIYYSGGNVGIGTSNPVDKLEVNGNILADAFKVDDKGYFQTQTITGSTADVVLGFDNNDYMCYERENDFLFFNVGGAHRMRITSDGKVGIGTESPDAPLHVNGAVGMYNVGATYFYGGSGLLTATTDFNVSIHASHGILTNGTFIATSDKRVKENITELDSSLDLISRLRPVSYNKIDRVEQGNRLNYGFIAQEVEEVIPVAVNTGKGDVPILQPFEKVGFEDGVTYTILVKNGDDIKEQTYTKGDARPEGEIIVKSKNVDDFKSLTYDMIFTVAVGAIQEQQAEIETLQQQVEKLQTQNAVLTQKTEAIDHLKAEVENLKKAMGLNIELTENK